MIIAKSVYYTETSFYEDIKKQVHELSTTVYQIKGYIKGKTLLPFPEVEH